MGVVGDHQGDARLPVEPQQPPGHLLLLRDAVVLELQVVAVLPEQLPHLQGMGLGPLVVPGKQQPGQPSRQAGGQGDEALAMGPQQVHVDPGLAVKALGEAPADHGGEVPVAGLVPAQQHQVIGLVVQVLGLVEPGPGGHIDLTADDGLDALGLGRLVEVHRAVHDPVVGEGHGGLAQVLHPLHQVGDAAGPVQQAVFGVDVQMDESHLHHIPSRSMSSRISTQVTMRMSHRWVRPISRAAGARSSAGMSSFSRG